MSTTTSFLSVPPLIKEWERYLKSQNLNHTLETLVSSYCSYGGPLVTILCSLELPFNDKNDIISSRRYFWEGICSRFIQRGTGSIFIYLKTAEQGRWFALFERIRHSDSGCQQSETYFWKVAQVTGFVHGECIWGPEERYTREEEVSETLLESQLHVCHVQNKDV